MIKEIAWLRFTIKKLALLRVARVGDCLSLQTDKIKRAPSQWYKALTSVVDLLYYSVK